MKGSLPPSCGLWTLKPRPRVGKADFTHLPVLHSSRNPLFLGQRAGSDPCLSSERHSPGKERATRKSLQYLQYIKTASQGSVGDSLTKWGMKMGLQCMSRSLVVRK